MMRIPKAFAVVGAVALSAIALASCRIEEQDRPLSYQKGEYLGPRSAPLDQETLSKIRARTARQADGALGFTATVPTSGADVRLDPPKK